MITVFNRPRWNCVHLPVILIVILCLCIAGTFYIKAKTTLFGIIISGFIVIFTDTIIRCIFKGSDLVIHPMQTCSRQFLDAMTNVVIPLMQTCSRKFLDANTNVVIPLMQTCSRKFLDANTKYRKWIVAIFFAIFAIFAIFACILLLDLMLKGSNECLENKDCDKRHAKCLKGFFGNTCICNEGYERSGLNCVGKNINTGFFVKDTISVIYTGKKGSHDWEKYGITLLFEDSEVSCKEDSGCPIKISVVEFNALYPKALKAESRIYHIDCPEPLNATVTIQINHTVSEEDLKNLLFLSSSDKQPPYRFSILGDAQFTSSYGKIKVNKFSFFLLAKLILEFGINGVMSYLDDIFVASLYYKKDPIYKNSSHYKLFYIYISVVKNSVILSDSLKKYILKEYGDEIILVKPELLSFRSSYGNIKVSSTIEKENLTHKVTLEPSEPFILRKWDIINYVNGCPPHQRFSIKANSESSWKLKIKLEGFSRHCTLTFSSDMVMNNHEVTAAPRSQLDSDLEACTKIESPSSLEKVLEGISSFSQHMMKVCLYLKIADTTCNSMSKDMNAFKISQAYMAQSEGCWEYIVVLICRDFLDLKLGKSIKEEYGISEKIYNDYCNAFTDEV